MTEDEIILTHILKCRPIDLALNKPAVTKSQQEQFDDFRKRRANGEPLQYILGTCNFMGLELAVNPSVLVPRPETEQLVDAALKKEKEEKGTVPFLGTGLFTTVTRILDLGTGSGNIAIALAKFLPQSQVVSIDTSVAALDLARANAKRHGVENQIQFVQDDFIRALETKASPWSSACNAKVFDLVISNPPYIPTAQLKTLPKDVQQEPALALDGGEDGLKFIRIIIKYSPYLLRKGGCLMMEFGDGQGEAVKKMAEDQKVFSNTGIIKDLAGRERIIHGKIHH